MGGGIKGWDQFQVPLGIYSVFLIERYVKTRYFEFQLMTVDMWVPLQISNFS